MNYSYHAFISDRAAAGAGGRPSPGRDRERDPRPQVRRRAEPSPLGPLRRERGVARGAGDRAQPRPLDGAARARRGNRDDQDAQAALLRSRRTAHPLGPALDPAPREALALGWPVGSRPGAVTGATAPGLTPAHSAGPGPRLAPACPRTPRAPSRRRPQRPRAVATAPRSGTARRTPTAERSGSPASRPLTSTVDSGLASWGVYRTSAPPARPSAAAARPGRPDGTGRGAVHDRPRFDALRDLRPAKEGARQHGYTGVRGYHPLLAVAPGRVTWRGCARAAPTPPALPA